MHEIDVGRDANDILFSQLEINCLVQINAKLRLNAANERQHHQLSINTLLLLLYNRGN